LVYFITTSSGSISFDASIGGISQTFSLVLELDLEAASDEFKERLSAEGIAFIAVSPIDVVTVVEVITDPPVDVARAVAEVLGTVESWKFLVSSPRHC